MSNGNDGNNVIYTTKELIAMLESSISVQMDKLFRKLDEMDAKLNLKASEVRVDTLEKKLDDTQRRVAVLELANAGQQAVTKYKWLWITSGIAFLAAATGLIYTIVYVVHG